MRTQLQTAPRVRTVSRAPTARNLAKVALLAVVFSAPVEARADLACDSRVLKATANYVENRLACHSRAAEKGTPVSSACIRDTADELRDFFAKLLKKKPCAALSDHTATVASAFEARLAGAMPSGDVRESKCDARALKGLGVLTRTSAGLTARFWTDGDRKGYAAALARTRSRLLSASARRTDENCSLNLSAAAAATEALLEDLRQLAIRCTSVSEDAFRDSAIGPWAATLSHAATLGYSSISDAYICPPEALHGQRLIYAYAQLSAVEAAAAALTIAVNGLPTIEAALLRASDDGTAVFGSGGGLRLRSGSVDSVVDGSGSDSQTASVRLRVGGDGECQVATPDIWDCVKRWCLQNAFRCLVTLGTTGCGTAGVFSAVTCGAGIGLLIDSALEGDLCRVDRSCTPKGFGHTRTEGCSRKGTCDELSGFCVPIPTRPDGTDCARQAYKGQLPQCVGTPGEELIQTGAQCCSGYCCPIEQECEDGLLCAGAPGRAQCLCSATGVSTTARTAAESCPRPTVTPTATAIAPPTSTPTPIPCGNGQLDRAEQCDDGNTNDADACTNECTWGQCDPSTCPTCAAGNKCLPDYSGMCACRSDCTAAYPDYPQGTRWRWGNGYECYPHSAIFEFQTSTSGTSGCGGFSGTLVPGGEASLTFDRNSWGQYGVHWEFNGGVDPDGCGFEGCMLHKYYEGGQLKEQSYLDCAGSHALGDNYCGVVANGQRIIHGTAMVSPCP